MTETKAVFRHRIRHLWQRFRHTDTDFFTFVHIGTADQHVGKRFRIGFLLHDQSHRSIALELFLLRKRGGLFFLGGLQHRIETVQVRLIKCLGLFEGSFVRRHGEQIGDRRPAGQRGDIGGTEQFVVNAQILQRGDTLDVRATRSRANGERHRSLNVVANGFDSRRTGGGLAVNIDRENLVGRFAAVERDRDMMPLAGSQCGIGNDFCRLVLPRVDDMNSGLAGFQP